MSEFVGGYQSYLALCEDARAYDEVLIIMAGKQQGEAKAQRIAKTQADAAGKR